MHRLGEFRGDRHQYPPAANQPRGRQLSAEVRVGDYARDNTNFYAFRLQASGVIRILGGDALSVPVDDNYDEVAVSRQRWYNIVVQHQGWPMKRSSVFSPPDSIATTICECRTWSIREPCSMVTLHGFGCNPETMMQLTAKLFDTPAVIAALQGPNQFFLGEKNREVGYGWITSRHPAEAIRLHREMVINVLNEAGREFDVPAERRLLVGFSQAVALNYRFVAACPEAVRGVAGICGGLPGDWSNGEYPPVKAAVLHIARREDEYYPPAVTEHYAERLRQRAPDVEFHLIGGGHRVPSEGNLLMGPWLRRILSHGPTM